MAALIHLLHNITTMLETNPSVIIIAVDFSKAFDSVRHSTLLQKYASLELQDNIYNWIESYFQHRSHSTTFRGQFSSQEEVTSSIVQGLSIGPASYVVLSYLLNIYEQELLTDWFIQHHVTFHTITDLPVLSGNLERKNAPRPDLPVCLLTLF
jgi:hypothetical protein